MKPPFITTTIKWMPYPENKPDGGDSFIMFIADGVTYPIACTMESFWDGHDWRDNIIGHTIIAFAEKPSIDPACEDFDFNTAVELMKAGYACVSIDDGMMVKIVNGNAWHMPVDSNGKRTGEWCETIAGCSFSLNDVLGKWRLA